MAKQFYCVKRIHGVLRNTYDPYGLDTNVTDALCDLLHYCDEKGVDFDNQLRIARDHYAVETSGTEEGRDWRKRQRTNNP